MGRGPTEIARLCKGPAITDSRQINSDLEGIREPIWRGRRLTDKDSSTTGRGERTVEIPFKIIIKKYWSDQGAGPKGQQRNVQGSDESFKIGRGAGAS